MRASPVISHKLRLIIKPILIFKEIPISGRSLWMSPAGIPIVKNVASAGLWSDTWGAAPFRELINCRKFFIGMAINPQIMIWSTHTQLSQAFNGFFCVPFSIL